MSSTMTLETERRRFSADSRTISTTSTSCAARTLPSRTALLEPYAGTETWVLGVDGDELYDPSALRGLRSDLEARRARRRLPAQGATSSTATSSATVQASGFLAPPSRPVTKLFNMAAVTSWTGAARNGSMRGRHRSGKGTTGSRCATCAESTSWESDPLRLLHVCFLRRSSRDGLDPTQGRPSAGRREHSGGASSAFPHGSAFRRSFMDPRIKEYRRDGRNWKRSGTGAANASPSTLRRSSSRDVSRGTEPDRRASRRTSGRLLSTSSFARSRSSEIDAFEVIVADDGSGPGDRGGRRATGEAQLTVRHVWQPHEGFRKARLLNRAALAASGDYLVFLDGDCLPRTRFVTSIRRARAARDGSSRASVSTSARRSVGRFSRAIGRSGAGHLGVAPPGTSRARHVAAAAGQPTRRPRFRSAIEVARGGRARPTFDPRTTAYGYTFGVWRSDLERVNGFDMRLGGWDGEDVDIAHRLAGCGCPVRLARP